jgi:hypothetical protein
VWRGGGGKWPLAGTLKSVTNYLLGATKKCLIEAQLILFFLIESGLLFSEKIKDHSLARTLHNSLDYLLGELKK